MTRTNLTKRWKPEYAIPPSLVLRERLEARGYSQAEFARRCGRSPKLISEILSGKAPIEPTTALQFEKVLGLDASIWINVESEYQLFRAKELEAKEAAKMLAWAKEFKVQELVRRGYFSKPESDADRVSKLLAFFRVASVDAWTDRYSHTSVAYRHSPAFKSNEKSLATWLRLGELMAEKQDCEDYHRSRFMKVVHTVRTLTRKPLEYALEQTKKLCNEAGVSFALIKPLSGMALSGAAWWFSPQKAVIQLTGRYKSDDQLWFSFFHEAAHILLHSKRDVFVDDSPKNDTDDIEAEANTWASRTLIPEPAYHQISQEKPHTAEAITRFAAEQGIAPGIVVGMLQHRKVLPWNSKLNWLKGRYELVG